MESNTCKTEVPYESRVHLMGARREPSSLVTLLTKTGIRQVPSPRQMRPTHRPPAGSPASLRFSGNTEAARFAPLGPI